MPNSNISSIVVFFLIISIIFAIINFFIYIINKEKKWFNKQEKYPINPLFSAIELFNEINNQKLYLLSAINEYKTTVYEKINITHNNIDSINIIFNKYLNNQIEENKKIGKNITIYNNIYENLINNAELIKKNLNSINKNISSSCTALVVVENQEQMLKDINSTFTDIFIEKSKDENAKIQRILDNLSNISYKCSHIQNFPKPYKEIIALYSLKIESIFNFMDRKKLNILFEEYMQKGKAYIYTEPNKAINEINEAIRINPGYAEAYYYRGIAYQLKDTPEYKNALIDFNKAYELKPGSKLYKKCIEELNKKINNDIKE